MYQITNKQFEKYQRLCHFRNHGQILAPDGLRLVIAGFDDNPVTIGKYMLEMLAKFQAKENKKTKL